MIGATGVAQLCVYRSSIHILLLMVLASVFISHAPLTGSSGLNDGYPVPTPLSLGWWEDTFDDGTNVTTSGTTTIEGGRLILNNTMWRDGFNRSTIDPWTEWDPKGGGTLSIHNEALLLRAGATQGAGLKAEMDVNFEEVKLEAQLKVTVIGAEGPVLEVLTGSGFGVSMDYHEPTGKLRLMKGRRGSFSAFESKGFTLNIGQGYLVSLELQKNGNVKGRFGSTVLTGTVSFSTPIATVSVGIDRDGVAEYDDVVLRETHVDGSAISTRVAIPDGNIWRSFDMNVLTPPGTGICVDIVDGDSLQVLPGYLGLRTGYLNLTGINPVDHPSLILRARMHTFNFDQPYIDSWRFRWQTGSVGWMDTFEDESKVGITGSLVVDKGRLMTPNILLRDGFDRLDLAPWSVASGTANIVGGSLRMGSDLGRSRVEHALDHFTKVQIVLNMNVLERGLRGPRIEMLMGPTTKLICEVSTSTNSLRIYYYHDGAESGIAAETFSVTIRTWYPVTIAYDALELKFTVGSKTARTGITLPGSFTDIAFDNLRNDVTLFDDIALSTPVCNGTATTAVIVPPAGKTWDLLTMSYFDAPGADLNISIVDWQTLEPFEGLEGLEESEVDLSSINPRNHTGIRVLFNMTGEYMNVPSVDWYHISFTVATDFVRLRKSFRDIQMMEDVPQERILNLTEYFRAKYSSPLELSYNLTHLTDPAHVKPYLQGTELSIDLPEENWNGEATFRITASSFDDQIETEDVRVLVAPVNDPPLVSELPVFDAMEDALSVFNLTPYISDVDTPLEDIHIMAREPGVTVHGLEVHVLYNLGGTNHTFQVEVADASTRITIQMDVYVQEVNDPPVVHPVPTVLCIEDESTTVDLSSHIEDEDNDLGELSLFCDDDAVFSVQGLNLTLLFTTWQPEHAISFQVSDGLAMVNGILDVQIMNVNDLPAIVRIGDQAPPVSIRLGEGTVGWYSIEVVDEDNNLFEYDLESLWNGISVFSNGTIRISTVVGDVGEFSAVLTVDDRNGGVASADVSVNVININDPPYQPVVVQPINHTQFEVGTSVSFEVDVGDPDVPLGDVLTVVWTSNISGPFKTINSTRLVGFVSDDLPVGVHCITVTVSDGEYTREAWFELRITNIATPPPDGNGSSSEGPISMMTMVAIAVALVILVGVLLVVSTRARRQREASEKVPGGTAAAPTEERVAPEGEEAVGPPALSRTDLESLREGIAGMISDLEASKVGGSPGPGDGEAIPEGEVYEEPVVEAEDLVPSESMADEVPEEDREYISEVREVMRALTNLPRGLPSSLWNWNISDLAKAIMDGEKRTTDDGKPLVKVKGTWYIIDPEDVGSYMNEWKGGDDVVSGRTKAEREEMIRRLEDRLVEGKISEETFERLRRKYGDD